MNWQESLEYLESVDFDFQVNVASSAKQFFRVVAQDPVVLEMYREIRENARLREEVLGSIYDLSTREIDRRYENPNDTALAVLLWLTYYTAKEALPIAAQYTARAPQCWHARKLASHILAPPRDCSGNSYQTTRANQVHVSSSATDADVKIMPVASKVKLLPVNAATTSSKNYQIHKEEMVASS